MENPYITPMVLTNFEMSDAPARIGGDSPLKQSITLTKSLTLAYNQRTFSFELHRSATPVPRKRATATSSKRWKANGTSDATRRSARYTTLAPGDCIRVQSLCG